MHNVIILPYGVFNRITSLFMGFSNQISLCVSETDCLFLIPVNRGIPERFWCVEVYNV